MNLFFRSAVQSLSFALVVLFLVFAVFYFGPDIETRFFPVVANASFVIVPPESQSPDELRILLHSVKQRENCELVDRLVSVRVGPNVWVRGTAFFKDEASGQLVPLGKTRPVGDEVVDEVHIKPKGQGLHIVLLHKCHPFWLSASTETFMQTLESQQNTGVQPPR